MELIWTMQGNIERLKQELAEAREKIDRLQQARDLLKRTEGQK